MGYRSVLHNHQFRLLSFAYLASRFGDVLAGLGFLFAAYEITGSKTMTTGVVVAQVAPYLLFGLIGGALSDLLPKVQVMIATDLLRAGAQLVTTVLFLSGGVSYPALLVIAFLLQLGGCFFNPCSRSVIVHLVGPEGRVAANSALSVVDNLSLVLGPLLATVLLEAGGVVAFFAIDGVTYVASSLALVLMSRRTRGETDLAAARSLRESGSAIRRIPARMSMFFGEIKKRPTLVVLFASTLVSILCSTWAWRMGFLFKTAPDPGSDKAFYSAMLAVFSATSLVVSLLLPGLFAVFRLTHYWAAVALWSFGLIILGFTDGPALTTAGVMLLGAGITTAAQARMFVLQHSLPPQVMGQGFSAAAVLLYAGDTVSLGVFGSLAGEIQATTLIGAGGIVLAVSVAAQWVLVRTRWPAAVERPEGLDSRA